MASGQAKVNKPVGSFDAFVGNKRSNTWFDVLSSLEDPILVTNWEGIIVYANDAATKLLRYSMRELHGKRMTEMGIMPAKTFRKIRCRLKSDGLISLRTDLVSGDMEKIRVDLNATLLGTGCPQIVLVAHELEQKRESSNIICEFVNRVSTIQDLYQEVVMLFKEPKVLDNLVTRLVVTTGVGGVVLQLFEVEPWGKGIFEAHREPCLGYSDGSLSRGLSSNGMITVPVQSRGKILGLLRVESTQNEFTSRDVEFFTFFGRLLGLSIENARSYAQAEKRMKLISKFFGLTDRLAPHFGTPTFESAILDGFADVIGANGAEMYSIGESDGDLIHIVRSGSRHDLTTDGGLASFVEKLVTLAVRCQEPQIQTYEHLKLSVLGLPLTVGGKVRHVIVLVKSGKFDEIEYEFSLILLRQIEGLMHNAELFRNLNSVLSREKALRIELESRQKEIESLLERLARLQEQERRHIAAELHDGPIQDIAGVLYLLDASLVRLKGRKGAHQVMGAVETAVSRLRSVIERIRTAVVDIELNPQEGVPLWQALLRLVRDFQDRAGIECESICNGVPPQLPGRVTNAIFRIAQEAFRNIEKHANASKVSIALDCHPERIKMLIQDDGVGFDPSIVRSDGGISGLTIMKERARLISGKLELYSAPWKGTRLVLCVPLVFHNRSHGLHCTIASQGRE